MKAVSSNIFPTVSKLSLSQISDYQGIERCSHVIISNGKVVQTCSSNYGLLKNENFFTPFEEKMREEHINFTAKYRNVGDCQFVADYILDGEVSVKTKKDVVQPKIRLINSYDGSCAAIGLLGYYRQICNNGLHAMRYEVNFKTRHTDRAIQMVVPSLRDMLEEYQNTEGVKIIRRFEVLAERPIGDNINDFVKVVCDNTKIFKFEKSDKNPDPSLNAQFVLDKIAMEARELKMVSNRWLVYNAFNQWLNSDERNKKSDRLRTDLDSKIFEAVEAV